MSSTSSSTARFAISWRWNGAAAISGTCHFSMRWAPVRWALAWSLFSSSCSFQFSLSSNFPLEVFMSRHWRRSLLVRAPFQFIPPNHSLTTEPSTCSATSMSQRNVRAPSWTRDCGSGLNHLLILNAKQQFPAPTSAMFDACVDSVFTPPTF